MDNYALVIKEKLMAIIDYMASKKEGFVRVPEKDFTRNRKLSFKDTIILMLSMGGGNLNNELMKYFNYNPNAATSSAFIQQRDKLLITTFKFILHEFTHSVADLKSYHGYRLLAVDGCVQSSRDIGEIKALTNMVDESLIKDKNVIVAADRGYESYNTFAHIEQKGWKYLIRVKDIESNGIVAALDLPMTCEFDEQFARTLTRKKGIEFRHKSDIYKVLHYSTAFDYLESIGKVYYPISFRIVRVKIAENNFYTFIANLDPETFGIEQIKHIYHMRWGIETSFRELKHTLGLASIHSKKIECIMQEVFAKMIMYNFCEIITLHVTIQQKQRKHTYQVKFSMAMSICRHFFRTLEHAHLPNVEALIQKFILPVRLGRKYPRQIKSKTFVTLCVRLVVV